MPTSAPDPRKEALKAQMQGALENPDNLQKNADLEQKLGEVDAEKEKELRGDDLEFNVQDFILYGVIKQENVKILNPDEKRNFPGLFVTMQSLTARQSALAKAMLRTEYPMEVPGSPLWLSMLPFATASMATVKMNKAEYPIPELSSKTYKEDWGQKLEQFKFILDSQDFAAEFLSAYYQVIDRADVIRDSQGGDTLKK